MGEWTDKIEGKGKEAVGTITGDESKKTEGKAQNTWGNVEGKANDVKTDVSNAANEFSNKNKNSDTYNEDTNP